MTGILARMQTPTFLLALLCSTAALAQTPADAAAPHDTSGLRGK